MLTTKQGSRARRLLVMATVLWGSGLAQPETSLSAQIAGLSGMGLTLTACHERMQKLDALLKAAGYGASRTYRLNDGTLVARWYNWTIKRTALAFSGQNAAGNAFSVSEHDGLIRMNERLILP